MGRSAWFFSDHRSAVKGSRSLKHEIAKRTPFAETEDFGWRKREDRHEHKTANQLLFGKMQRSRFGSSTMNDGPETEARLVSVNVALPRGVSYRGRPVQTGIFKTPVNGPVMVRRLNLDGDRQADLSVHGGPDKAVYVYSALNYDLWRAELGRDLAYGQFGENLTTTNLLEDSVHIDDILEVGSALLQVTQPRFPCFKLGIKMADQRFLRRFLNSGRSGFYCRVLGEGTITVGDAVRFSSRSLAQPTIAEIVSQVAQQ